MALRLIPVVVSGGAGTRLWPLSTEDRPKQFHAINSEQSLLQETVSRLEGLGEIELHPPILICNSRHAALAQAQMQAVGCTPARVVLEPFGRNTAAVAMAASLAALELDPQALILLMPSDHMIARPAVFGAAIADARAMAQERFVLFGIVPDRPETGYGYIEAGAPLGPRISAVTRFVEKPDLETAERFLAGGRHLWNAGIFLFPPALLIDEMERFAPEVAGTTRAAFAAGARSGPQVELDADLFQACPSVSLDYAVMERTDKAVVTPIDAGWADVGSWRSVWEEGPFDDRRNAVLGDVELIETEGCLVWSGSKTVAALGLRDLIIVQTDDAVLVLPKDRAQDVKLLVERLRRRNAP